jgi:hypothetical protein
MDASKTTYMTVIKLPFRLKKRIFWLISAFQSLKS